jgi:hypothetical protein
MDFSISGYKKLLLLFKEAGYSFVKFNITTKYDLQNQVVIRHDIDVDLVAALRIAETEKEMGILSTYFITLRSPFYNPLSNHNKEIVNSINKLGHSVAIHIDLASCDGDYLQVQNDLIVLKLYFPFIDENFASLHCPGPISNISRMFTHNNIRNIYGPILNNELIYISDSGGNWKFGTPVESDAFKNNKSIQLLTHPIWWVNGGISPVDKLERFIQNKYNLKSNEFKGFLPNFFQSLDSKE